MLVVNYIQLVYQWLLYFTKIHHRMIRINKVIPQLGSSCMVFVCNWSGVVSWSLRVMVCLAVKISLKHVLKYMYWNKGCEIMVV